ncbi:hypothetical protein GRS48_13995 [Halorubrum sp. JWXQ-INN 858]|uniref:hypothetical protein n=1 Tax=Halorubrum sp. JWXQ-INN 858 TaxID=2690782 RepID=UPI001359E64E|nr:hypothetical protein [Halorubrum sp. JWXQ-INN 858]MWV65922.1 hypothetical protein [Halorubrum sp. JWXQ-INN 858]
MSATDPLDDVALNTYEVEVPIELDAFETTETASLTVAETAAQSIVSEVAELGDDDVSYVSTQVSFDMDGLEDAFEDDEIEIATVQTRTELAVLGDD